jgi:hypothetical protein
LSCQNSCHLEQIGFGYSSGIFVLYTMSIFHPKTECTSGNIGQLKQIGRHGRLNEVIKKQNCRGWFFASEKIGRLLQNVITFLKIENKNS